jgi:hypothetical protein
VGSRLTCATEYPGVALFDLEINAVVPPEPGQLSFDRSLTGFLVDELSDPLTGLSGRWLPTSYSTCDWTFLRP